MIKLSKSSLSRVEKDAVLSVLDKEYLGMGDEVNQFESDLSSFFGRTAVCVVNGTAALHLALEAAGIGFGDEVLVPSLTYVASFQAIMATGAKAIACDVDLETLTLDPSDARKRVTSNTKAIMPVHYAGGVGALDEIYKFADNHNLRVIEDAAHAFGSEYQGKRIGGFGDIACFSFDGIKNITSGEGGCVVTSDESILNRVRDARLLGVENDTDKRYHGERSWRFNVTSQGWRYHMSNIMAAIGIVQLQRFSEFSEKRKLLAKHYDGLLKNRSDLVLLPLDYNVVTPHIYVVRILNKLDRRFIEEKFSESGIQVGSHYQPNHWLDYFKNSDLDNLKVTDEVFPQLLTLPLHTDMSKNDVDYIVDILFGIMNND